jgi:recombination protein RecA
VYEGNRVRVKVKKNKVAPPFRTAEFDILFNEGISAEGNILDVGVEFDIIERAGSWYSYGDEKLGQGRTNAIATLKEDTKLREKIEKEIKEKVAKEKEIPLEVGGEDEEESEGKSEEQNNKE